MIISLTKDLDTIKRLIVWFQPNLSLHKPKGNPIMSNSFFAQNLLANLYFDDPNIAREPASYTTTPLSSLLQSWQGGFYYPISITPSFLPGLQTGDPEEHTEQFSDIVTAALFNLVALIEEQRLHDGIQKHTENQEKIALQLSLLLSIHDGKTLADAIIRKATEQGRHDDVIAEAISLVLNAIEAFSTPPKFQNYR